MYNKPSFNLQSLTGKFFLKTANDNFDFSAAAAEIRADFPHLAGKLYFVDSFKKEYVRGHAKADASFDSLMQNNPSLRVSLNNQIEKYGAQKNSMVFKGPQSDYFIALYTGADAIALLGTGASQKQALSFVIDHEIGHIVTQYGQPGKLSRTLHECTADAYAALRQLQRFGSAGMENIEGLRLRRAQRLISLHGARHAEHFTSFVLDKIIELAPKLPLSAMTAQQTAEVAARIAIAYTPNDQIVKNVQDAFTPFQDALARKTGDDTPYRMLAQVVLETHSWEIFKWGAPVLRGYLRAALGDMQNGDTFIEVNKTPLEGPGWQRVANELAQREFAFNREQILFGLDLPEKSPAARAAVRPLKRAP